MQTQFITRQDARDYVANSGIADWTWNAQSSADGFADWLYQNRDGIADADDNGNPTGQFDDALREYFASTGDNAADYGL